LLPRAPAPEALAAAKLGIERFEKASKDERDELPGTLPWLLFSPTARDGSTNPVFKEVQAFAAGDVNPQTGRAYPYRCWYELTQVLVPGGAKYPPTTSAQLEGLFNALTRQQGASKVHISQPQVSFEARCCKNDTVGELTESVLRDGWADAKAVEAMCLEKGFWSCDIDVAANRKFCQKLKEEMQVDAPGADDVEEASATHHVEKIVWHEKKKGAYTYATAPS
jgi:hypothetical protein